MPPNWPVEPITFEIQDTSAYEQIVENEADVTVEEIELVASDDENDANYEETSSSSSSQQDDRIDSTYQFRNEVERRTTSLMNNLRTPSTGNSLQTETSCESSLSLSRTPPNKIC
jgi:hypothetical protein